MSSDILLALCCPGALLIRDRIKKIAIGVNPGEAQEFHPELDLRKGGRSVAQSRLISLIFGLVGLILLCVYPACESPCTSSYSYNYYYQNSQSYNCQCDGYLGAGIPLLLIGVFGFILSYTGAVQIQRDKRKIPKAMSTVLTDRGFVQIPHRWRVITPTLSVQDTSRLTAGSIRGVADEACILRNLQNIVGGAFPPHIMSLVRTLMCQMPVFNYTSFGGGDGCCSTRARREALFELEMLDPYAARFYESVNSCCAHVVSINYMAVFRALAQEDPLVVFAALYCNIPGYDAYRCWVEVLWHRSPILPQFIDQRCCVQIEPETFVPTAPTTAGLVAMVKVQLLQNDPFRSDCKWPNLEDIADGVNWPLKTGYLDKLQVEMLDVEALKPSKKRLGLLGGG